MADKGVEHGAFGKGQRVGVVHQRVAFLVEHHFGGRHGSFTQLPFVWGAAQENRWHFLHGPGILQLVEILAGNNDAGRTVALSAEADNVGTVAVTGQVEVPGSALAVPVFPLVCCHGVHHGAVGRHQLGEDVFQAFTRQVVEGLPEDVVCPVVFRGLCGKFGKNTAGLQQKGKQNNERFVFHGVSDCFFRPARRLAVLIIICLYYYRHPSHPFCDKCSVFLRGGIFEEFPENLVIRHLTMVCQRLLLKNGSFILLFPQLAVTLHPETDIL